MLRFDPKDDCSNNVNLSYDDMSAKFQKGKSKNLF